MHRYLYSLKFLNFSLPIFPRIDNKEYWSNNVFKDTPTLSLREWKRSQVAVIEEHRQLPPPRGDYVNSNLPVLLHKRIYIISIDLLHYPQLFVRFYTFTHINK